MECICYLIDSKNQRISVTTYNPSEPDSLHKLIGGYITLAKAWPNGDVCYVDDEGLLKNPEHFFIFSDHNEPFAGNGVIVGQEIETGDSYYTKNPATDPFELIGSITFLENI